MKLRKLHAAAIAERGLTLIEILLAVAILGIIMPGIGTAFIQTLKITAASNNSLQAIRYAQNAGVWVLRDGQQAQTVTADDPTTTEVTEIMTIVWNFSVQDPTLGSHIVRYASNGTDLTRSDNGGASVVIARGVNAGSGFVLEFPTESIKYYKITVTSIIGGFEPRSASLSFYFKPRLS